MPHCSPVARSNWHEIDLLFEHIDLGDGDLDEIAGGVGLLRATPDESTLGGFVGEEIVGEHRDVDEAGEEEVGQFDQETEVADVDDASLERLAFLPGELLLEELELLELGAFALGLLRGALGGRDVLGEGAEFVRVGAGLGEA